MANRRYRKRQRKKYQCHVSEDEDPRIPGSARFREVNELPPGHYTVGEIALKVQFSEVRVRRLIARMQIRSAARSTRRKWLLYDDVALATIRDLLTKPKRAVKPPEEGESRVEPKPYEPKMALKVLRADSLRAALGGPKVAYGTEESKLCFPLLHSGKALVDIVLETGLHPAIVSSIHDDYCNMIRAIIIPRVVLDVIDQLPLDGTFPIRDAAHVLEVMEAAAAALACEKCKQRKRVICAVCARDHARAAVRRHEKEALVLPPAEPLSGSDLDEGDEAEPLSATA